MRRWIVALGALLLLSSGVAAAADVVPTGQSEVDPFERLFDSLEVAVPEQAALDSSVRALETTWRQDPTMAALERRRPGILAILSEAARPTLASWSKRVRAEFRPRYIAALRNRLTTEEAVEIAGFYETPLGQKLLASLPANYTGDATAAVRAQGEAVTPTHIRVDAAAASNATLARLSEMERAELAREAASRPALLKLGPARAEFSQLRALMEREPLSEAEHAMLNAALKTAFDAH